MERRKKSVSLNTLVKMFMRDNGIPTKRDIERLMIRIDRLEQMLRPMIEEKRTSQASGPVKNGSGTAGKAGRAAEEVIRIISEYRDGITFADIQKRTGFDEKKLRNIIYRLDKKGQINRLGRGIYIIP